LIKKQQNAIANPPKTDAEINERKRNLVAAQFEKDMLGPPVAFPPCINHPIEKPSGSTEKFKRRGRPRGPNFEANQRRLNRPMMKITSATLLIPELGQMSWTGLDNTKTLKLTQ
jgi:hypothetical protein